MTPKEARELWCKTLESGDYEQGTGQLKHGEGYCCLGVACEIAVQEGVIGTFYAADLNLENYPAVQKWLGLDDQSGGYDESCLVDLNDSGRSFQEIAALIRSEPEGLVVA